MKQSQQLERVRRPLSILSPTHKKTKKTFILSSRGRETAVAISILRAVAYTPFQYLPQGDKKLKLLTTFGGAL